MPPPATTADGSDARSALVRVPELAVHIETGLRARARPERAAGEKAYLKSSLEHYGTSVPAVKSYQQLLSASGMPQPSYLGLEVFINTQALLDGLRKAGPGVQRSNLPAALEALGELRYGHMQVRLAAPARTGSSYVGLAMIDQSGQFRE